jgi:hypothetical protein
LNNLDALATRPPDERCRISVAIPAKNEERYIVRALEAFARQRSLDGRRLDPRTFEVVVLANDCSDGTAAVVRRFASDHPEQRIVLASCALPPGAAHIGTARRFALDLAADRQSHVRGDAGVLASTDADSQVDRLWIARTLAEMTRVDAVAGHVEIGDDERARMEAPLRLLYDRERSYRRTYGEMEAWLDPRPYDPPSRHDSLVGASFAVRVGTYVRAGRLPAIPRLEDVAFARALLRSDARIRHSYDVRVTTSSRTGARVAGGFGTFLDDLRERSSKRATFAVENARRSIKRAAMRCMLRDVWSGSRDAAILAEIGRTYGIDRATVCEFIDASAPFGASADRFAALSPAFERLPDEPVDSALATLRAMLASAIAASATRKSAASGAG